MSSDQIVKALRKVVTERCHDTSCKNCVADHFRAMDPVWGACDDGTMLAAADLIESQQAQFVAKDAEVARLTAERAAMIKALQRADIDCDNCKQARILHYVSKMHMTAKPAGAIAYAPDAGIAISGRGAENEARRGTA